MAIFIERRGGKRIVSRADTQIVAAFLKQSSLAKYKNFWLDVSSKNFHLDMNMAHVTQELHQSAGSAPVTLVQTDALSYLLDAVAEQNDVGFFCAPSESFARIPGLAIDEDVVLATVVTARASVAWGDQLRDWVIPFNATDARGGPVQTMLSLGNGPLAVDFAHVETMLERVREHILVAYILPGCVGIARYRWNAQLLGTMNQLYEATKFYESLSGRVMESDSTKNPSICNGATRAIYGRMHADGSVEFAR
jgi:hypothetical protein